MLDIITVGETLVSFTPEEKGDLCYVDYFKKRIAGSESNVAIGACKLRHSAGWVSRLGDDSFGDYILNMVRSEGVDVGGVIQSQMCIRDRYRTHSYHCRANYLYFILVKVAP